VHASNSITTDKQTQQNKTMKNATHAGDFSSKK